MKASSFAASGNSDAAFEDGLGLDLRAALSPRHQPHCSRGQHNGGTRGPPARQRLHAPSGATTSRRSRTTLPRSGYVQGGHSVAATGPRYETLLRLHRVHGLPLTLLTLLHHDERALDAARATDGTLRMLPWNRRATDFVDNLRLLSPGYAPPHPDAVLSAGAS
jgi:hypothetical protein